MKIRFLTSVAGARFAYEPGDEPDLRVDVAREFIQLGQAVIVPDDEEQAIAGGGPEVAARRVGGRRRSLRNLGGLLPS